MQLQAIVTAIGKRTSVFKNEAGESITSYTGNGIYRLWISLPCSRESNRF